MSDLKQITAFVRTECVPHLVRALKGSTEDLVDVVRDWARTGTGATASS